MSQSFKKIGLALSGGGLRASFFHIGLLAQMAEQGILKYVTVISTVSGGSIIGALYYLHLKKLLESELDTNITDQHYIDIIKTIEVEFLEATEKNIRMSVLTDFKKNVRMIEENYSNSDRIAELYNEFLYQPITENLGDPVEMRCLKINPLGEPADFHPISEKNDLRNARVPILVLNATTLNGGKNWQFTARTMGEPPSRESQIAIDKKPIRLCRATGNGYQNMVEHQQNFPLGHAVAASACVPGLFDPLAISGLYHDKYKNEKIIPQLVDGGIFDNQGVESLLKHGCTHFIVSDAAAQMGMENAVKTDPISVLLRVSNVLQDRVRTESLSHLIDNKGEENIVFINLRKGLGEREISWINQHNVPQEKDKLTPSSTEKFSVDPRVQEKISLMRTDLDAFTEVEAYSLMLVAYLMSREDLATKLSDNDQQPEEASWKFMQISDLMKNPKPQYLKQLEISQSVFGKALLAFPYLWIPIVLFVITVLFFLWSPIIQPVLNSSYTVYAIVTSILLWLATIIAPKFEKIVSLLKYFRPQAMLATRLVKLGALLVGTLFIVFYLKFINPLYLSQGRVAKLKGISKNSNL